jgi:hypothetical protein
MTIRQTSHKTSEMARRPKTLESSIVLRSHQSNSPRLHLDRHLRANRTDEPVTPKMAAASKVPASHAERSGKIRPALLQASLSQIFFSGGHPGESKSGKARTDVSAPYRSDGKNAKLHAGSGFEKSP